MNVVFKRSLVLCGVIFGLFIFIAGGRLVYAVFHDQQTIYTASVPEYDDLFAKEQQNLLQIKTTIKSKTRPPVSSYVFDKKYNVSVFQLNLAENTSLKSVITAKNEISDKQMNAVYSGLPGFNFNLDIKAGKQDSVKTLDFRFSGGQLVPVANNDSVFCYYYKFETFSLSYNNAPFDIIAKADNNAVPASIAFIKKSKKLDIVLLSLVEGGGETIAPDALYNMIKK
jgi:hypothetical protein